MSRQIKPYVTPEEYLALERKAEYKSEYLHGEIFAMTGASRKHNLITGNIGSDFNQQLRGKPCEAYRTLDSLAEHLLVAQDEVRLEQYIKQPNGQWLQFESTSLDGVVELPSISCSLALRDVYDKVSFDKA